MIGAKDPSRVRVEEKLEMIGVGMGCPGAGFKPIPNY
jgi:hypothetical protein